LAPVPTPPDGVPGIRRRNVTQNGASAGGEDDGAGASVGGDTEGVVVPATTGEIGGVSCCLGSPTCDSSDAVEPIFNPPLASPKTSAGKTVSNFLNPSLSETPGVPVAYSDNGEGGASAGEGKASSLRVFMC